MPLQIGYEPLEDVKEITNELCNQSGGVIEYFNDPKEAIKDSDVVITDTWISMGQEDEKEKRLKDFQGYMVDSNLMSLAKDDAIFLHCLPAYRDYEVSEEILEKYSDVVFDEAENRLHAQKGLIVW